MKQAAILSLLFVMLVLTACPLSTNDPIDTGSYNVPTWLYGEWISDNGPSLAKEHYTIEKGNKKTEFKCYSIDSLGRKTLAYDPVIMSNVGGKVFLSAHESAGGYLLFQLEKESETAFELKEVDEDVLEGGELKEGSSSAEIKKFLAKNLGNEEVIGASSRYKKVK
jgi:hypothetical protein